MCALAVLHIPHSATLIPANIRKNLVVSDDLLARELLVMTDWYTDELFALTPSEAITVRFPVSRLVLDPERFVDDAREPMASRGMGLIYTHTSNWARLREDPTSEERSDLIERYYTPHHLTLSTAVGDVLKDHGNCLLIDCHSFPSYPLPCDQDQAPDRPDICLGTDNVHTPAWLVEITQELFNTAGLSVAINRPYAGVLIPAEHSLQAGSIHALMIEINRRLYMGEQTGSKLNEFARVAGIVQGVLRKLLQDTPLHLAVHHG